MYIKSMYMGVVRRLGERYFGIEAKGISVNKEAFDQIQSKFDEAIQISDEQITVVPAHPKPVSVSDKKAH